MKVFLGGTCNGSKWREELIPMLKIDYFNPVVEDWTPECQAIERYERSHSDFCLYVITPQMRGVYSMAEAVDDSNKRPEKVLLVLIQSYGGEYFDGVQWRSLLFVSEMVKRNGGRVFPHFEAVAGYLNTANN